MPSDIKKPQEGSMSTEQLAEKLEKSEAGRKKLRQAISILQEKLEATDKVLKVNETLRQECDLERQRAAEEKKKAEEEKRLRCILENESAAFKEQIIKISKRLGVVENKQKSDKKEIDRLRAEVKVAVEGVHAAAKTVDAMQISFESLESDLLEKVRVAVEGVHTVSQAVNAVKGTLQSLENTGVQKVMVDRKSDVPKSRDIPEKLVDDITRLFLKEKKSHVKIQQQLTALKGMLKSSRVDGLLSVTSVDTVSKERESAKKRRVDGCRKRRSTPNEDPVGSKAKKGKPVSLHEDEIRKHLLEKNGEEEELSRKHKKSRSSDKFKVQLISEKPNSLLQGTFKAPPFRMQSAQDRSLQAGGCLLGSSVHAAVPHGGNSNMIPLQSQEKLMIGFRSDLNNGKIPMNVDHNDADIEGSEQDLDFISSDGELEDDWWFGRKALLSPNLPEICSPVYDLSSPFMDPSGHNVCTSITSEGTQGQNDVAFESNEDVLNKDANALTSKPDDQPNTNDFEDIHICKEELENGMNKTALSALQSQLDEKVELKAIDCDHVEEKVNTCISDQNEISFEVSSELMNSDKDTCTAREENSLESLIQAFSECVPCTCNPLERTNDTQQKHNGDFQFEDVDTSSIKEISNFLETLPSVTCAPAQEVKEDVAIEVVTPTLSTVPCDLQMTDFDTEPINTSRNIIATSADDLSANDSANALLRDMVDMVTSSSGANRITEVSKALQMPDMIVDNNQLVENLSGQINPKQGPTEVALLHGFRVENVEGQINMTMAAIIAMKVTSWISFTGLIKQQVELQKAIDAVQKLPTEYVACSFMSSIVEMIKLDSKGECSSPESRSLDVRLRTFLVLISNVFNEKSAAILDIIFTQLVRFLNEGKITQMRLQGIEALNQDVYISASMIQSKGLLPYHYAEATLEDAHAGSKVLAGLCQLFSSERHLQTVVYEVLGWCDKDAKWLLTIFSSFASICGHTSFMAGPNDLLGHAICAIISELVASAEQGKIKELEMSDPAAQLLADESIDSQMLKECEVLKKSLEIGGKIRLEAVLLSVLVILEQIFSSTHDSLLSVSPLTFEDYIVGREDYNIESSDTSKIMLPSLCYSKHHEGCISSDVVAEIPQVVVERMLSENQDNKCSASHQLFISDSRTVERRQDGIPISQVIVKSRTQDWKSWQKKYCEVIGALELIAVHMGWEWTYNELIIRHLWRMVMSGSSQISIAGVSHVLSIMGRLGLDSEGKELPGVEELKRCLIYILQSKSTSIVTSDAYYFSFLSQAAATHALLKLDQVICSKNNQSGKPNEIDDPNVQINGKPCSLHIDCVKEWLHDNGEVMQASLPNIFKEAYRNYSHALPS